MGTALKVMTCVVSLPCKMLQIASCNDKPWQDCAGYAYNTYELRAMVICLLPACMLRMPYPKHK